LYAGSLRAGESFACAEFPIQDKILSNDQVIRVVPNSQMNRRQHWVRSESCTELWAHFFPRRSIMHDVGLRGCRFITPSDKAYDGGC